jgi:hypothetical protein
MGPTRTLFHLGDDPEEAHDLITEWPEEVDRLQRALDGVRAG